MKTKKTWYGHVNFILYGAIVSIAFVTLTLLLCINSVTNMSSFLWEPLRNNIFPFVLTAIVIIAFLFVYFILTYIRKLLFQQTISTNQTLNRILYGIVLVLLFGAGIYVRFFLLQDSIQIGLTDSKNYELAIQVINNEPIQILNNCEYAYVHVISFFIRFFGQKQIVVIYINSICQLLASILLLYSVRELCGKVTSIVAFGATMILPYVYLEILDSGSECLVYLLFSVVLSMFVAIMSGRTQGEMVSNLNFILFALQGLLVGFLLYLDVAFVSLLVIELILIAQSNVINNINKAITKRLPVIGVLLLFILIGTFGSFFIDSLVNKVDYSRLLLSYFNQYFYTFTDHARVFYPTLSIIGCVVVYALLFIVAVSYLMADSDRISWLFVPSILVVLAYSFLRTEIEYTILLMVFYFIFAGIGVDELLFVVRTKAVPVKESEEGKMDNIKCDTELKKKLEEVEILSETIPNEKTTDSVKSTEKPIEKPRFIENPLPLPKPHVKKVMDYAIEPNEKEMKFDIEIKKDDDFDI